MRGITQGPPWTREDLWGKPALTQPVTTEGWGLQGKVGECLLLRVWVVRAGFLEEETLNEHPLKGE